MDFKKKYLLLSFFLIVIFQIFIYTNNKQKSSLKYFKWTIQDVSIGKLISISFFSGFFVSALLSTANRSYKEKISENIEENYESPKSEENIKTNTDMPPLRDIRDVQPTISVNYRVVRDTGENNTNGGQNYSKKTDYIDDWENDNNDW